MGVRKMVASPKKWDDSVAITDVFAKIYKLKPSNGRQRTLIIFSKPSFFHYRKCLKRL